MIGKVKHPVAETLQQYASSDGLRSDAEKPVVAPATPAVSERVELSSRAREIRQIRALLANAPDIRKDKVMELKRQIEDGSYRVQPGEISKKMIGEALIDIFA